jgi:hypothetical protein
LINIVVYTKLVADLSQRISRKGAKDRKDAKFVAPFVFNLGAFA